MGNKNSRFACFKHRNNNEGSEVPTNTPTASAESNPSQTADTPIPNENTTHPQITQSQINTKMERIKSTSLHAPNERMMTNNHTIANNTQISNDHIGELSNASNNVNLNHLNTLNKYKNKEDSNDGNHSDAFVEIHGNGYYSTDSNDIIDINDINEINDINDNFDDSNIEGCVPNTNLMINSETNNDKKRKIPPIALPDDASHKRCEAVSIAVCVSVPDE